MGRIRCSFCIREVEAARELFWTTVTMCDDCLATAREVIEEQRESGARTNLDETQPTEPNRDAACSFCQAKRSTRRMMIGGGHVHMCEACVERVARESV